MARTAFWTCGLGLYAVWNAAVLAGAPAGRALGDAGAYGLDAAYPAVLLALVLPALREQGTRWAALLGAAAALAATPLLPAGSDGCSSTVPRCCWSPCLPPVR